MLRYYIRLFVNALYDRIDKDDIIPRPSREAVIALYGGNPTVAFGDNTSIVLQFNIFDMPDNEPVWKI